MTLRIKLLAAAALVLPATMASAQQPAPTAPTPPLGSATNPAPQPVTPPAETPALNTVQQPATPPAPAAPAETADDVAEQAADAVEADAVAQTRVQAAAQGETPTATPPAPATAAPPQAPVQAQAQPPAPPAAPVGPVSHATAADLRTGAQVRDQQGGLVGTVESADAAGAVVTTGTVRARIALNSFGRNNQGLVIALTRAQFEAAASAANPS